MADDKTFGLSEMSSGVDLQAELNKTKAELDGLNEKYKGLLRGLEPVTTRKISQVLAERGYEPNERLSHITFTVEDEIYEIYTDELPMVNLIKRYRINNEDEADFKFACQRVIEQGRMTKAFVTDDGEGIYFYLTSFETDCRHFEKCFDKYLEIINNAVAACMAYYNQGKEERRGANYSKGPQLEKES